MKYAYICDGCKKTIRFASLDEPPPAGWLAARPDPESLRRPVNNRWDCGPWSISVVACSADCVNVAKEEVKRRASEAVERFKGRIDAVRLERMK